MDSRILIFVTTALAVLSATIIGVAVGSGEYLFPVLAVLCILAVLFIAKPEISTFLTVCLFASRLNAPGLPGQFGLYEIAAMSTLAAMLIVLVFTRQIPIKIGSAHWLLIAFCTWLMVIGYCRGFGLRFLGSDLWGGYVYIQVILAAALVFAIPIVNMPAVWWRRAIFAMGALSLIPVFADLLTVYGFRLGYINLFVQAGGVMSSDLTAETGQNVDRLSSAGTTAQTLLLALLALVHTRNIFNFRSLWVSGALIFILLLSFVSGFRLMTATVILITFLVILLQRTLTPGRVIACVIGCLIGLGVIYQIADALPPSIQRAISWLPGVQISQSASIDANATVSWRLELWQEAVKEVPEYLWLGRGLAFNGDQLVRSFRDISGTEWAMVTGAFHNGYLSLIILTGIPGLVLGIALMVSVVIRHWRLSNRRWNSSQLHTAHQVFLAVTATTTLVFLTVYGDINSIFPSYFLFWGIMEGLCKADEKESVQVHSDGRQSHDYAHLE
jgi:hypothetical protein